MNAPRVGVPGGQQFLDRGVAFAGPGHQAALASGDIPQSVWLGGRQRGCGGRGCPGGISELAVSALRERLRPGASY
jgi:hypothetical protein